MAIRKKVTYVCDLCGAKDVEVAEKVAYSRIIPPPDVGTMHEDEEWLRGWDPASSQLTAGRPAWILDAGVHAGFEWGVANVDGYRCGYVRIPAGHPWHGKDPSDMEPWPDVHRGLDYTASDTHAGWWLGFCCAHAGDAQDPSLSGRPESSVGQDIIRSTAYVRAECQWLIRQAIDAAAAARRVLASTC